MDAAELRRHLRLYGVPEWAVRRIEGGADRDRSGTDLAVIEVLLSRRMPEAVIAPVLLRHLRALQVAVAEFQRILQERGLPMSSSAEGRDPSPCGADEVRSPAAPEVYLFRMQPNGVDLVPAAVGQGLLMTGWSRVVQALDAPDFPTLKELVRQAYFTAQTPDQTVTANAASLWNFCRMRPGDLVVVPHGRELYVGTIKGDAYFDGSGVAEDSAHRRPVAWIGPFPRAAASPALQSSCRTPRTSTRITPLLDDVLALIANHRGRGPGADAD